MPSFPRCLALALVAPLASAQRTPVPDAVPARWADALVERSPTAVRIEGWLGARVLANARTRLPQVDLEPLLAGFRQKPGLHPWIGEHIGKWMHAATLAWAYTGDEVLRRKLDEAAAALHAAQEPDGYLGTYPPDRRFGLYPQADWDVWSHKYGLIGLLTYHRYTGEEAALDTARRIGDLLVNTFGAPPRKSLLSAGTHMGMAATSVLQPMVWLYRATGDMRYLAFCRTVLRAWDEENGPRIIASLRATRRVDRTANAKAYEMLSNLVGLCELARVTGERDLLTPVLIAWEDIVAHRLYLTGSASQGEHFRGDHELPNGMSAHVAETCVTTTWLQLNAQLLRLTGEARFGDQLERTLYNHLAAAQRPDGAMWCYFTALEGTKPYGPGINCCVSSGPRAMALAPQQAFFVSQRSEDSPTLFVNLHEDARVTTELSGHTVTVVERRHEERHRCVVTLTVSCTSSTEFALAVRKPTWADAPITWVIDGEEVVQTASEGPAWLTLPARTWNDGDRATLSFACEAKLVHGTHGNTGHAALTYGPWVLAYDTRRNPGGEPPFALGLAAGEDGPRVRRLETNDNPQFEAMVRSPRRRDPHPAVFVPFADAGVDGGRYRVWLHAPDSVFPETTSLGLGCAESRSRTGNVEGSIVDLDPTTFVVTYDGTRQDEDWFALDLGEVHALRRIVYAHGKLFHDGGWFDASRGKPRLQVRRAPGGAWETVGELTSYPHTTATDARGLRDGQAFEVSFDAPEIAVAIRVIGVPAHGDRPEQSFSSCAELQAFAN